MNPLVLLSPPFYIPNKDVYPPFKKGLYLEEYFLEYVKNHSSNEVKDKNGYMYIPALWTNFQIDPCFENHKLEMQQNLDDYIQKYPCEKGYFTVVQYDDGPVLRLPPNTLVYGACSGNIPLPLIYQDVENKLMSQPRKTFSEKNMLCSFVGTVTHPVRTTLHNHLSQSPHFHFFFTGNWTPAVNETNQDLFMTTTMNSKFALAPRGNGRSSFRFFEIFQLGSIPVYVWDDIEWLPYQDKIDYSKICISIHTSKIHLLEEILLDITEEKYKEMRDYYEDIVKPMFSLDYMCQYILLG